MLTRILCVESIYSNERIGLTSYFMPSVVFKDWQSRFLSKLKSLGYQVSLKPHPESNQIVPRELSVKFNIPMLECKFEDVITDFDLFIFSNLSSSCFSVAVMSGKPILFVDFGLSELNSEAQHLLAERCSVIKGYFDDDNRACIDWADINKAIDSALTKKSDKFEKAYYTKG